MSDLAPLQELFDATIGEELPLPDALEGLYGRLLMPRHPGRPHVVANFVSSLDGVVSLGIPGKAGGGEISGFNPHDRMVMGLLRAAADAVVIGAGTLRAASPRHLWTADYIHPPLAAEYRALRAALGVPEPPLNVVVTASGDIDLDRRLFRSDEAPWLLVTTAAGAKLLRSRGAPSSAPVVVAAEISPLSPRVVLDALCRFRVCRLVLSEAGPRLMSAFVAAGLLDELFLTVAPQVAGRDGDLARPGFVAGTSFAPNCPIWGTLIGAKRGGDHLFLRYGFAAAEDRVGHE